jgi:hypothetical protein
MTSLHQEQYIAASNNARVVDFDLSKMGSTLQETLQELAFEGDFTVCTEDESDDSSQAGNHFAHLKSVDEKQAAPAEPQELEESRSEDSDIHVVEPTTVLEAPPEALQERFSTRRSSILKHTLSSEEYILTKKRLWKNLPPPNMERIKAQSSDRALRSSAPCYTSTAPKRKKSIVFHEVEMRFYEQTLGDHPNTSYGPPISLDWKYEEAEPIDVEEYEEGRGQRRSLKQMMLNYYTRKNILLWHYGHSEDEIKKATKASEKAKFQRGVTRYFLRMSKVEDLVTSAGRKVKRATSMGSKKSSTV